MTREEEIYKIAGIISPDWCKGLDCRECYAHTYYGYCQYVERAERLYEYLHDEGCWIDRKPEQFLEETKMTNREWLNSLTDEELMHWLYDEQSEIVGWEPRPYLIDGKFEYVQMPVFDKLYPRFHEIGRGWTSSSGRFMQWIKEERQEGVYIE